MDRLESMAVLLAVVELGSLSAAGRKLGMPLATVSRKISELESHLKVRLLNAVDTQARVDSVDFHFGLSQCRKICASNFELNKLGQTHSVCGFPWRKLRCKPWLNIRR